MQYRVFCHCPRSLKYFVAQAKHVSCQQRDLYKTTAVFSAVCHIKALLQPQICLISHVKKMICTDVIQLWFVAAFVNMCSLSLCNGILWYRVQFLLWLWFPSVMLVFVSPQLAMALYRYPLVLGSVESVNLKRELPVWWVTVFLSIHHLWVNLNNRYPLGKMVDLMILNVTNIYKYTVKILKVSALYDQWVSLKSWKQTTLLFRLLVIGGSSLWLVMSGTLPVTGNKTTFFKKKSERELYCT